MSLSPLHATYLKDRGITEDTAISAGYSSVTSHLELLNAGYSRVQSQHFPGLLIPLYDAHGNKAGHQYHADNPRRNRSGKPMKFDTPQGQPNRVSFQLPALPLVHDKSQTLMVVEGPVKALSVWENLKMPAATITGVWNWLGRASQVSGSTTLPDWRELDLKDRLVYLCFDNDIRTNMAVRSSAEQLAGMLRNREAKVKFIILPEKGSEEYVKYFGSVE